MVKRPTGSGGEPSSPNCGASAGGKARQLPSSSCSQAAQPGNRACACSRALRSSRQSLGVADAPAPTLPAGLPRLKHSITVGLLSRSEDHLAVSKDPKRHALPKAARGDEIEVLEKDSDTSWAMFQELQRAQEHGFERTHPASLALAPTAS